MWNKFRKNVLPYFVGVLIPLGIGTFAAFLTRDSMNIYESLKTPPLSPPSIVFPIVWTVLYTLMGISSAVVYINRKVDPTSAALGNRRYFTGLLFNFAWSIIFFNLRSPLAALVTIFILLYLVVTTAISYSRVSLIAALLQIPYIIWITFAAYLNAGVYFLN